jgi:xanthine dehydrogenase accessory factor
MRDAVDAFTRWSEAGRSVAVATVVAKQGSAPRPPGTTMLVAGDGEMAGSVSGGCVENDVVLHALAALESGRARLATYGIADEEAFEVGLACGGTIEVLIRPADASVLEAIGTLIDEERPGALVAVVQGPGIGDEAVLDATGAVIAGSLGRRLEAAATQDAVALMETEQSRTLTYGEVVVFVGAIAPAPRLVVFGAGHISQPLVAMARLAGFRVVVADPRPAFATRERFPEADDIVVDRPERLAERIPFDGRTYGVILNHDPRHEDPVLAALLRSDARYVGAMGSRRTHAARRRRLREMGFGDDVLERIYGPIGLDLGGESPAEIAVSILGEIIAVRHGTGTGASLRGRDGPIHGDRPDG